MNKNAKACSIALKSARLLGLPEDTEKLNYS
jgi:hypothetical protein